MINMQMIELLLIFSVAVWALVSKTPVKALVKTLATMLFNRSFPLRERFLSTVPSDEFEQYVIKFFAALIALLFIGIAQVLDVAVITANLSEEWQWLENAELVSAVGVISLIPVKYSLLYYLDILLTVALIGVVGSAGIHRLEKWLTGNGLLFDVLRQWLLTRGQAGDLGTARGEIDVDVAANKLYSSAEKKFEKMKRAKQEGIISDE